MTTQTTTNNRIPSYVNEKQSTIEELSQTTVFVCKSLFKEIGHIFSTTGFVSQTPFKSLDTAFGLWTGQNAVGLSSQTSAEIVGVINAYFVPLRVTNCRSHYQLHVATKFEQHETLTLELNMAALNDALAKALGLEAIEPIQIDFDVHIVGAKQANQLPIVSPSAHAHVPVVCDLDISDLRLFADLYREHWREALTWANVRASM